MDEPGFGKAVPVEDKRPLLRIEGVKLQAWPIALALVLGFGIPLAVLILVPIVQHFIPLPDLPLHPWLEKYYESAAQFGLTIAAISFMKSSVPRDYGFRFPAGGERYFGSAIFLGALLGILMALADFWPDIAQHRAPSGEYELTPVNIAGWLTYRGIFLGIADETLWRGLLVTYLAASLAGRVSLLRFEMNLAGVVVALIFALPSLWDFVADPPLIALAKMFVAFLQGVFFAYWFEKSKSLAAPVIGHGVCFGLYQVLIFAMVAAWGSWRFG